MVGRSCRKAGGRNLRGWFLDVFEAVNREVPFNGLRWFFDHAETVTERSLERVLALGGGIAVQHRMAYQGEYLIDRYGHRVGVDGGGWQGGLRHGPVRPSGATALAGL